MYITVARNREALSNLHGFVMLLRRLRKSSIAENGTRLLWQLYKNADARRRNLQDAQLLNSYGPRIIVLALATCNDHRNLNMTPPGFLALCKEYLGIYDSRYGEFSEQEAREIHDALIEAGNIPARYLPIDQMRAFEFSIVRMVRSQHEGHMTSIEELYGAFRVFEIWDEMTDGSRTELCRRVFNLDPIHFFRSGFMLFALANDANRLGFLHLRDLTAEDRIVNDYQITPDTCRLVASKISFNDSDLRGWYENMMGDVEEFYQKYFPVPLYRYPLIHLDRRGREIDYVIPSPSLFVRGFVNAFFSQLFENDSGERFGDAIEQRIYEALVQIFGREAVTRLEHDGEHADFLIRRDECDLVLEIKTALGGYEDQSVMTPNAVQKLWARLYRATKQCAASIAIHRRTDHPIVGIIVVSDHMTVEGMPFLSLAERTGILTDMDILGVDILSWNSIEYTLSQTSVAKFMATLKRKWVDGLRQSAGDLLTFEVERDTPAHQFEHLAGVRAQMFAARD
jgi:hypothetical protein